jgi:hypothetical protein
MHLNADTIYPAAADAAAGAEAESAKEPRRTFASSAAPFCKPAIIELVIQALRDPLLMGRAYVEGLCANDGRKGGSAEEVAARDAGRAAGAGGLARVTETYVSTTESAAAADWAAAIPYLFRSAEDDACAYPTPRTNDDAPCEWRTKTSPPMLIPSDAAPAEVDILPFSVREYTSIVTGSIPCSCLFVFLLQHRFLLLSTATEKLDVTPAASWSAEWPAGPDADLT